MGYEDLDDNGDWRDDSNYGHVWYPIVSLLDGRPITKAIGIGSILGDIRGSMTNRGAMHRFITADGCASAVAGVGCPARRRKAGLCAGAGGFRRRRGGFGGNIAWFPLGPREVYVPSYPRQPGYMNRVNVSSTTVNTTTITNVYNTTIVNRTTNITNVTYANRGVPGAVTAVSQRTFTSAQPVAHATVAVNAQQIASMPVSPRVAVEPTRESVFGAKASTANHVNAPPAAVVNRQVIAKKAPPPPPVSFEHASKRWRRIRDNL